MTLGFTEDDPIWAFVVIPHEADWLFNCWHLGSLDRSPQDVIQMPYNTHTSVWFRALEV